MAEAYVWFKDDLLSALGLSDGMVHLHVGLAIYVFGAFMLRMRLHSYGALAAVLIAAFGNEVIDVIGKGGDASGAAADIVNTILWPLIIFTFARARHEQMIQYARAMRVGKPDMRRLRQQATAEGASSAQSPETRFA